jgi:ABC-type multidrug transport system fused ATPase/permease subunit
MFDIKLLKFYQENSRHILIFSVASIFLVALELVFFQVFSSSLLGIENYNVITTQLGNSLELLIFIFILRFLANYFYNYCLIFFAQQQQADLRQKILVVYSNQEYAERLNDTSGERLNVLTVATKHVTEGILLASIKLASELMFTITLVIYLTIELPMATSLLAIILLLIGFLYIAVARPKIKVNGEKVNNKNAELLNSFEEFDRSYKFLYFSPFVHDMMKEFQKHNVDLKKYAAQLKIWNILPKYLLETGLMLFLIFIFIQSQRTAEALTLDQVAIIAMVGLRVVPAITSILNSVNNIYFSLNSLGLVRHTLEKQYEKLELDAEPIQLITSVDLKRATLRLNDKLIFQNITKRFERGTVSCIQGPSGCGKTRLIDAIAGLIQLTSGSIAYTSNDGTNIPLNRNSIEYLPQVPSVMRANIYENVIKNPSTEKLAKVRQQGLILGLKDLIEGNRVINPNGENLSGGQVQRIAFLRAINSEKPILILDEFTSAVDSKHEGKMVELLHEIKRDKIVIIVSHSENVINTTDIKLLLNNDH